ncbi:OsmC/Ohr family protein [Methyloglobulus morosus KoM1]|uniref:OsmC/Ohr family protein n=1 Tax=Methyloglobulus morosus KoM1 TaxID=1116472 RepID=V5C6A0_9GAMM|nr:OsmC family protein [Methyloglobulus morosus]ESS72283.1 OsmC/Ohr family protein [Methyloglobulus morosus KoM1]
MDNKFSRSHQWEFDGPTIPASSAPSVLPASLSSLEAIDPEEALVVATSSCHKLFFLYIAARRGFVVDNYSDQAFGVMGKNPEGKTYMSKIALRPRIEFSGSKQPDAHEIEEIHHDAHGQCFVGNSLKTEIVIEVA